MRDTTAAGWKEPHRRLQMPRWLVDDRFDAAMNASGGAGWRQELPNTGLRALAIPLGSATAWAAILLGVNLLW